MHDYHSFSPQKIKLTPEMKRKSEQRNASADLFAKKPKLKKACFEDLIFSSFSARMVNGSLTYPYPSGGGLYTGQVVVYVRNVEGYDTGSYHYLPVSHQFEKLDSAMPSSVDAALFMRSETHLAEYDFFILYGSLADKHVCKYGHRGYRLALMEIGSMYRNMEIAAQQWLLASRVWGGFRDEELSVRLGVDPRVLMPAVCQIIGRK